MHHSRPTPPPAPTPAPTPAPALALAASAAASATRVVLERVVGVVGSDRVLFSEVASSADSPAGLLGPNTSMFRSRRLEAVIRPGTAEETRGVVEAFAGAGGAVSLHVFSTGRNWGLGSREPTDDDVVALDLSDLDRVREMDLEEGWAVVEPGVTQGRLSQLLEGTGRMVNVTVSAAATSVVGNALDRGVGLRHQRVADLLGLEVVLPDGEVIRVGWWPGEKERTALYPHGLGPSLLPLFTQSSLGVVTAATVRLLPRPEALRVMRLSFPPAVLPQAITTLKRWVSQGLTRGVPRVFDPAAGRSYGGREEEYTVHLCVDGTTGVVDALLAALTTEAHASGLFTEVSTTDALEEDTPLHPIATLVERAYAGDPDQDDTLFKAKLGAPAHQIDSHVGFVFFLPLIPFSGQAVARAQDILARVKRESGIRCAATLHLLDAELIDCVVAVKFDRDPASARRARQGLDLMYRLYARAGFLPYRLDIEHAALIDELSTDAGALELTRRIKSLIDPDGVIAPGRYR